MIIEGKKSDNETCFQDRTHRVALDWLFDRIWTQKSKSSTLIPKTNSQTCQPREISHVTIGIIFRVCSSIAISVLQIVLEWCHKESNEERVTEEKDQWWVWLQGLPQLCLLLHQKARWREFIKVKVHWVCKLRKMIKKIWSRTMVSLRTWIRESGTLLVKIVHKVNGTLCQWKQHTRWMGQNGGKDDGDSRRKRTPSLPCHESIVQRSAQEQRLWKMVDPLFCRSEDWPRHPANSRPPEYCVSIATRRDPVLFGSADTDLSRWNWFAMDGSDTSSTFTWSSLCTSWDPDEYDEHNKWNLMLGLLSCASWRIYGESYLDEVVLGRIALSCLFTFAFAAALPIGVRLP